MNYEAIQVESPRRRSPADQWQRQADSVLLHLNDASPSFVSDRTHGQGMKNQFWPFGGKCWRPKCQSGRHSLGLDAPEALICRLCCNDACPYLMHVQLVLPARGTRKETAEVPVGHHVESCPTAWNT